MLVSGCSMRRAGYTVTLLRKKLKNVLQKHFPTSAASCSCAIWESLCSCIDLTEIRAQTDRARAVSLAMLQIGVHGPPINARDHLIIGIDEEQIHAAL